MQKIKIGLRIAQRRKELGLTQGELAEKMGYKSKSTINKIEKCLNDVSQSNVVKFAAILQTTEAYLMGWTDNPDKNLIVTKPFSTKAMNNILTSLPSYTDIFIGKLNIENKDYSPDEIEKAMKLYEQYRNAIPQVQSAVEALLKPSQSES